MSYQRMTQPMLATSRQRFSLRLFASYLLDWIVLVIIVIVGGFLGRVAPNKRPFRLDDPDISFPYTVNQTVPASLLVILCALVPIIVIAFVSLIFIPGGNVPKSTPKSLVWKRKFWELHVGWLGLLMAVGAAFFFVSGIKNMCGKPRPDLLSRCEPDLANAAQYVVGGLTNPSNVSRLYSGDICKQTDKYKIDDGFRSYPSGHSASAAAGLIYLSLFLAGKFSVTIPFVVPSSDSQADPSLYAAFPSRTHGGRASYRSAPSSDAYRDDAPLSSPDKSAHRGAQHNSKLQSMRRQAAAPPVYLLAITLVPFCLAIFIAASRWFDYRHHGFDILFGFLIGIITAIYSFRYYHLPIIAGAGWAWGSRSEDRAFWAGVGRLGFVGQKAEFDAHVDQHDSAESADVEAQDNLSPASGNALNHRAGQSGKGRQAGPAASELPFHDVELQNMQYSRRPGQDPSTEGAFKHAY